LLITRLRLQNFKSYKDTTIEFKEGINGILGDNGHGKTTILEAIGYTLFNYIDQRVFQKDLIRKGEKNGEVTLWFELGDELEYQIRRGVGKQVFEITLGTGKKLKTRQDCEDWMLNTIFTDAEEMSNVEGLFSNIIGVPQGQFTAAFALPQTPREKVFNPILRLDEYDKVWQGFTVINSAINKEVDELKNDISYLKGQTKDYENNKKALDSLLKALETLESEVEKAKTVLKEVEAETKDLEKLEKDHDSLNKDITSIEKERTRISTQLDSARKNLASKEKAEKAMKGLEGAYKEYMDTQSRLDELGEQQKEANELKNEQGRLEERLNFIKEAIEKTIEQLKDVDAARKSVEKNADLPKQLDVVENERRNLEGMIAGLEEKNRSFEEKRDELDELIEEAGKVRSLQNELEKTRKDIKDLESKRKELDKAKEGLAGHRNEIAQLMKFQQTIEGGKCPFLDEKCQQIEGDLNVYFSNRLKDVQEAMGSLAETKSTLEKEVEELEEKSSEVADLEYDLKSSKDAAKRVVKLEKEVKAVEKEILELPKLEKKLDVMLKDIEKLKPKMEAFRKNTAIVDQEKKLKDSTKKDESEAKDLEKRIVKVAKDLQGFAKLDQDIAKGKKRLRDLEPKYKRYEQEKGVFNRFEKIEDEIKVLEKRTKELDSKYKSKKEQLDKLGFRPVDLKKAREELSKSRTESAKIVERQSSLEKERKEKERRVKEQEDALTQVRVKEINIEEKRQFRLFANFIRETIRSAGPLVGTEIVNSISRAASEIYCEILSDHSQQLSWTKEYDIEIASPEGSKVFKQLSGGEQMSAALALRLAMLKHLARSDLVFLDEPTQNLDDERRRNLAQQITKITGFKQMFIITHDDTFSQDYEYVIRVNKKHGVSEVAYQ
jgi:exonuclease SbcC